MPTIDLTDEELAALTAVVRRVVDEDKFPHASSRCARRWRSSFRPRHRSECPIDRRYLKRRREAEGGRRVRR
jgi:hypothetical protein